MGDPLDLVISGRGKSAIPPPSGEARPRAVAGYERAGIAEKDSADTVRRQLKDTCRLGQLAEGILPYDRANGR